MSPYDDIHVNSLRDLATIAQGRRRELGLSQAELARRARVSRQWVNAFERGKATAEIGLVIRLLDALDLRMAVTAVDSRDAPRATPAVDLDALLEQHRDR